MKRNQHALSYTHKTLWEVILERTWAEETQFIPDGKNLGWRVELLQASLTTWSRNIMCEDEKVVGGFFD